jgi:ATP-binding cassette subfamily B protein
MVPQSPVLFSGTLRENITFGLPPVSDEKLRQVLEAANLTDLVDSLPNGVDSYLSEHGGNLSGGQRQRIAIARALVRDPKVILLDEATSALDSISERKIQNALDTLVKGRTTLVVAHRLSTIRNADRIAVIEDGCCVELGDYDTLMAKKGAFWQLKQYQQ